MATKQERDLILGACIGGKVSSQGFVRVNCPVCLTRKGSSDRRGSLGYRPLTGGFRCFRCGVNGRMDGAGYIPPEQADAQQSDEKPRVTINREDFFPLWTDELRHSPALAEARAFLERRGIMWEHWRAANIHAAIGGYYDGRVIVPHEDFDGVWWGFTARAYRELVPDPLTGFVPPKVLYPKGMDRTKLYNEQALDEVTDVPVMLVEGCLDAAWYLPDVVAALGKPTVDHFEKLRHVKRPLCVCLDGDAWEEGRSLAYRLKLRGVNASYVRLPSEEDPNSVDPDWLREQVANATEKASCRPSNPSSASATSSTALVEPPSTGSMG